MSASTPIVARATSQRRMNHSTASEISTAVAAVPSTHNRCGSWCRTGPSITAFVISGIVTVATRLSSAATSIATHRTRYGFRYGSSRRMSDDDLTRRGGGAMAGSDRSPGSCARISSPLELLSIATM